MKNLWVLILLLSTPAFAQKPELVKDINPSGDSEVIFLAQIGNTVFFRAKDGVNGRELWVTDGTEAGTNMVKDIYPGTFLDGPSISDYAVLGNKLIFRANDANEANLWISDGTSTGTSLLKDIRPGKSANPRGLTEYNGKVYFAAIDDVNGYELWVTDGTTAGTQLLKDINTAPAASSIPSDFVATDIGLFFYAEPASGEMQLWVTDGTTTGTIALTTFGPVNGGGRLSLVGNIGNDVVLYAETNDYGQMLIKVDATDLSIDILADEVTGEPCVLDNKIYFTNDDATNGHELWISDGTIGGTQLLKDINATGNSYPERNTIYNGKVYFSADNGIDGYELWVSDGTTAGTLMVKDILATGSATPLKFYVYNGKLLFAAADALGNFDLWQTDGTTSGTTRFMDLYPGGGDLPIYYTYVIIGSKLYLTAKDGATNTQLWVSDAGANPTMLIPDIAPLNDPLLATEQLWDNGSGIYFRAEYSSIGSELYKLVDNTTGVTELGMHYQASIYPNPTSNSTTMQLALKERADVAYSLYNLTGMQVTKPVLQSLDAGEHQLQIDMSNLPQGMYLIEISVGAETGTTRVIKVD